jgi:hypothetical protein
MYKITENRINNLNSSSISPLGTEPGSLMTGCKRVLYWTSETWSEYSEIAGSAQLKMYTNPMTGYKYMYCYIFIQKYRTNLYTSPNKKIYICINLFYGYLEIT